MKLTSLLTAALLPAGLLAAPVTEDEATNIEARAPADVPAVNLKRETRSCEIIGGSKKVNCRAGASTSSKIVRTVDKGDSLIFTCVKSGECVTINGVKNCGWDYASWLDCYINGHYTDSSCTQAGLGWC